MRIAIIEASEDLSVTPRHFRTKSYCLKLVARGVADWVAKTVVKLREGLTMRSLNQLIASYSENEVWRPTFEIKFDPNARFGPALRYPLLIARRQQSFAYAEARYA